MSQTEPTSADGERVVAVINSTFHLQLLETNLGRVDAAICLHDGLWGVREEISERLDGCSVHRLELETFSYGDLLRPLAARRRNHAVYDRAAALLRELSPGRLILFVEAKPMSRFLLDTAGRLGAQCELWEDGLFHYLDLLDHGLFRAKGLAKLVTGYYRPGVFSERLPRDRVRVRDRFEDASLDFPVRDDAPNKIDRVLFLGQPLVDDRLVADDVYDGVISGLPDACGAPVDYLKHPRESVRGFSNSDVRIVESNGGAENYCAENDYRAFVSAFSTSNLNIGRFEKNYYIPAAFGLDRVASLLRGKDFIPVRVVDTPGEIRPL